MSIPTKSKKWILANKPTEDVVLSGDNPTFQLEESELPDLKEGQILVKVLYLSNDPAQRGWIDANIDPERLYVPPVGKGETMRSRGIGEVVESKSQKIKKGQKVQANVGWADYVVLSDDEAGMNVLGDLPGGLSVTHYLGALGLTGLTAYYGLVVIGEAKEGETVLVSGAAGATGSMVVQIAKHMVGAKNVVGIAGTDEKCRWVESLGADKCLNYKSKSFEQDLSAATKDGFDVFFDNVGGDILDAALLRMNKYGRIACCGAITGYNSGNQWNSKNYFQVITMRLQLRGMIVLDFMPKAAEAIDAFKKALGEGKIKIGDEQETVVDTKFDEVPKTWTMLFEGSNRGKLVTKLV